MEKCLLSILTDSAFPVQMGVSIKTNLIIAAVIFTAGIVVFVCCKGTAGNSTPADLPEKISTWYGQICNVYQERAQDTVDHNFYLEFWDDSSYSINDSMRLHASGVKVSVQIEAGDWTKSESTYTFIPSLCVDQTSGEFSAMACTTASYIGTERDTMITIPQFLNEPVDLILTRL
jgi:hypothetical protein